MTYQRVELFYIRSTAGFPIPGNLVGIVYGPWQAALYRQTNPKGRDCHFPSCFLPAQGAPNRQRLVTLPLEGGQSCIGRMLMTRTRYRKRHKLAVEDPRLEVGI